MRHFIIQKEPGLYFESWKAPGELQFTNLKSNARKFPSLNEAAAFGRRVLGENFSVILLPFTEGELR